MNSPHKSPVTRKLLPFDDHERRCSPRFLCGFGVNLNSKRGHRKVGKFFIQSVVWHSLIQSDAVPVFYWFRDRFFWTVFGNIRLIATWVALFTLSALIFQVSCASAIEASPLRAFLTVMFIFHHMFFTPSTFNQWLAKMPQVNFDISSLKG